MRRSPGRPLLVSARLSHCVAFNPSPVTSLVHSLFTQCQGPTCGFLAARPRSHPVPLYLALTLTLTHVRSHAGYLMHDILLTHIFAHCHASSHRTLTLHHAAVPSHCLTFSSHWLALFRSTLPHSATLPFVWLSHWLSIMLCHSCYALLSHAPPSNYLALTITLTHVCPALSTSHTGLTIMINMLFT